jgi:hypothetical protein
VVDVVQTLNQDAFQEERALVTPTGFVDCFICGHRVLVTKADRIDKTQEGQSIGPVLFMHRECGTQHAPILGVLYENAVRGILTNLVQAPTGRTTPEEYYGG